MTRPDETRSDDEIRRETVALARTERPTPGEIGRLQSHALLLLADRARLVEENAELRAKLELPCGSCHPCNNWSDETWRRAGRKPPHVHEWDAARAEVTRLEAERDALPARIGERIDAKWSEVEANTKRQGDPYYDGFLDALEVARDIALGTAAALSGSQEEVPGE